MTAAKRLTRRQLLAGSGAALGLALLAPGRAAAATGPPPASTGSKPGQLSANGWPIGRGPSSGGSIWPIPLVGIGGSVDLRIGEAAVVLLHVVRRFHYEVAELELGDVVGYRPQGARDSYESNHLSGTACDIGPTRFVGSGRSAFDSDQIHSIRSIVEECQGVVAWAGEDRRPAAHHFDLAVPPGDPRLAELAASLTRARELLGQGAGRLASDR